MAVANANHAERRLLPRRRRFNALRFGPCHGPATEIHLSHSGGSVLLAVQHGPAPMALPWRPRVRRGIWWGSFNGVDLVALIINYLR